jgi:hypothetical protein
VFAAAARQYPLTLEFAIKHTPRAEYTANVHVTITDAQGQRLLDTRSDGPFLLAKLPAGQYTVMAERHGQTLARTVVSPHLILPTPYSSGSHKLGIAADGLPCAPSICQAPLPWNVAEVRPQRCSVRYPGTRCP